MSQPRLYKVEAIVLKYTDLGEADRIVTLFSPYLGKIRAVAKGVRRPRSKLGGHLEPLNRGTFLIARGRNLDIISQCQTIDTFLPIRQDLGLASQAFYLAELVDHFAQEGMENYLLYRLFQQALESLGQDGGSGLLLRHFELHLLINAGYRPQLHQCLACRSPLAPEVNYFSTGGGVLCPRCQGSGSAARPISVDALKVLRFLEQRTYAQVQSLHLDTELSQELELLLRQYLWYHLEREVKAASFLDTLRREAHLAATERFKGGKSYEG